MATFTASETSLHPTASLAGFGALARLAFYAALPLAAFSAVNVMAEAAGVEARFFSPAGLPGWAGAGIHLAMLFSIGLALALVGARSAGTLAWGVALLAGIIAFPFAAAPLNSLTLALMMAAILLLALATAIRISKVSRLGGWLMVPALCWFGFAAALGLAVAAAWSPPFALITAQNPAPTAG